MCDKVAKHLLLCIFRQSNIIELAKPKKNQLFYVILYGIKDLLIRVKLNRLQYFRSFHIMIEKLISEWPFPPIGQRMLKTSLAVFCCLLIYRLLGYQGSEMPAEAAITAIICMQPYVSDSKTFAANRFTGTIVGTLWGMLFLLLMTGCPHLGEPYVKLYAIMAVGVLAAVYTTVLMKVPDTSGLAAIVFICIVVQYPEIEEPFLEGARRFLGVMIGTSVAILINTARLPRSKKENTVFFIRGKDLTPNRFSKVPASVLFHMNRLYQDGAKICIMLEHAPALFTLQMSSCHLNMPLIVMDGAAIYDITENRYLAVQNICQEHSAWLQSWLKERGINYFTYVIRHNRTVIYHEGRMTELELEVLKHLQRSPYRSYLDDENLSPDEIVYLKIIAKAEYLRQIEAELQPHLAAHSMRMVIRDQASTPGAYGLYIFSDLSTPSAAQERYMEIMRIKYPGLQAKEVFSRTGYRTEHDASALLHRLQNAYEPLVLSEKIRSFSQNRQKND